MSRRVIFFLALAGLGCLLLVELRKPRPLPASTPPALQPSLASAAEPAEPVSHAVQNAFSPPLVTAVPAFTPLDNGAAKLTAAIRQGLSSTNADERDLVFSDLLPALVALDAPAAGKLAESLAAETSRDEVLSQVAQLWGGKDPAGALAWAAQLSDTNEMRPTLADVLFRMGQADPVKAMAAAKQYPAGADGDVLATLAQQWADKDLPAAAAWAGNQPASPQRDQIVARIALVESKTAPEAAGALIVTQMQPGAIQNEAAISVLYQWIQKDFDAASAWVNQFPESPLKERALAELEGYVNHQPKPSPGNP